jgi:hypothetical protein
VGADGLAVAIALPTLQGDLRVAAREVQGLGGGAAVPATLALRCR